MKNQNHFSVTSLKHAANILRFSLKNCTKSSIFGDWTHGFGNRHFKVKKIPLRAVDRDNCFASSQWAPIQHVNLTHEPSRRIAALIVSKRSKFTSLSTIFGNAFAKQNSMFVPLEAKVGWMCTDIWIKTRWHCCISGTPRKRIEGHHCMHVLCNRTSRRMVKTQQ